MLKTKTFFLNGTIYHTQQNITLFDILNYFNYKDSLLVLEYNKRILSKENWKKVFISDQDRLEIVTIVGGG